MSDSQSHSNSEDEIIYEEEEVLWAKIRGYPWWPAFVDKVHGSPNTNSSRDEMQYTVFFFGDNTHSRLGGSKLRRFLDYYTEFFPKAKTNRKLYMSIMKAEQKLKQNGGNVDIFENLRNSLKKTKKPVGRLHNKTESKMDSQDHHENVSEQPQLVRTKTYPHHDVKQSQNNKQYPSQQHSQQKPIVRRRGRRSRKQIEQQEKEQLLRKQKLSGQRQQQQDESMDEEQQQQKKQKQSPQQQPPVLLNYRTRSGRNRVETINNAMQMMVDEKEQQRRQQLKIANNQEDEEQQSSHGQKQVVKRTAYPLRYPAKTKPLSRGGPKKRGRPKKVVEENNQESQSEETPEQQVSSSPHQNKIPSALARAQSLTQPRKSRSNERQLPPRAPLSTKPLQRQKSLSPIQQPQQQQKQETSQQTKKLILSRVAFCIDKRNQLIEYLDELNITTDIVQEILELNVSTVILQKGEHTAESIRVLHKLRSALEHKYFPKDIKIKKKYEKLSKKANSAKTNTPQNEESLQDLDLRKKTLIKLQKILKNIEQSQDQKTRSIEIESHFRRYDQSIGNGYKTMAYKVLRSIKDKTVAPEEVLSKLQSGEFDQDEK